MTNIAAFDHNEQIISYSNDSSADLTQMSQIKNVVYKITITGSNKSYIGSTTSFLTRKKKHLHGLRKNSHPNKRLQNSYNKHGKDDSFLMTILEQVSKPDALIEREQFWIDQFDKEMLFNIRLKADSSLGVKSSQDKIEKDRQNALNRYLAMTEEEQKAFSHYWKGKKRGKHHGAMVSKANKGRVVSEETREKNRQARLGKKLDPSHIEKIRQGNLGKKRSEESRTRISQSLKGRKLSDTHRNNLSANHSRKRSILQLDSKTNEIINEFDSIADASRHTGYLHGAISNCCQGLSKTSYGYKWKYKE
jgi:group I intron endonuclease